MRRLLYILVSFLMLMTSCDKFEWHNPYDPECPKELFTPSSPGATMEGNSVKLTWSQQNDDISGFALFRRAEGEGITALAQTQKSTTQYLDGTITAGKKYTYYVLAVAGENKSDTIMAEITPVFPITISTGAATEVASTSAKVSGNVTSAGGGTVTSRGICWSTSPNPTVNNSKTTEGTGVGQYTSALSGLLAGTTYYARAYGENSRGIVYGNEVTFTTLGPPKLTTAAVTGITETTATSGGTITSDGGSPITAKGVVWSTSPSPTISLATKTNDGTGVGAFTSSVGNLTNNTKYYIRSYATNAVGTSYGEELSFTTTIPVPPILESLKQGLVAYYPFNGNANDESGNGNNGTVNGAILTSDRLGNNNKAYLFDGINDFIQVASSNSLNMGQGVNFTISMFYKTINNSPASSFNGLITKMFPSGGNLGSNNGWQIGLTDITLRYQTRAGSFVNEFSNPPCGSDSLGKITTGRIDHFIFEFDRINGKFNFYKNGVLIVVDSCLDLIGDFTNNYPLLIGTEREKAFYSSGIFDEIRIYKRLLTIEEITYLANN